MVHFLDDSIIASQTTFMAGNSILIFLLNYQILNFLKIAYSLDFNT